MPSQSKNITKTLLMFLTGVTFFRCGGGRLSQLRGLLFICWIIRINLSFVSCYNSWAEVLVIYDFIQQFLAQNTNHCFCLSVSNPGINLVEIHRMFWSNPGTNLVQIHHMFKSSLQICSHVPYKRPHLSAISKMVFQWSSRIFTMQTFTFLYVRPVEGQLEH